MKQDNNERKEQKGKRLEFKFMRKLKIIIAAVVLLVILGAFASFFFSNYQGCASFQRDIKSCQSDLTGGLDRTVNIYSYDGTLIASYTGKIDIEENESKVLFDLDGKRYIYYNAIVEVIEN